MCMSSVIYYYIDITDDPTLSSSGDDLQTQFYLM